MLHYCGIDLHSNNHVVVVIDGEDKHNNLQVPLTPVQHAAGVHHVDRLAYRQVQSLVKQNQNLKRRIVCLPT